VWGGAEKRDRRDSVRNGWSGGADFGEEGLPAVVYHPTCPSLATLGHDILSHTHEIGKLTHSPIFRPLLAHNLDCLDT
jgi:hypothetical protein